MKTKKIEKLFANWAKENHLKIKLLTMLNKLTEKEKIVLFQSVMGKK
jgi:hypothetical protein